jgi:hypothetical protein
MGNFSRASISALSFFFRGAGKIECVALILQNWRGDGNIRRELCLSLAFRGAITLNIFPWAEGTQENALSWRLSESPQPNTTFSWRP